MKLQILASELYKKITNQNIKQPSASFWIEIKIFTVLLHRVHGRADYRSSCASRYSTTNKRDSVGTDQLRHLSILKIAEMLLSPMK